MRRFLRPLALLALPLMLAACSGNGSSALPQSPGGMTPQGRGFAQLVANTLNPTIRQNCGPVGEGYARCLSVVRTDVGGNGVNPNAYGPPDLQAAYNLPSATKGNGQTVGIVDAFDDPTAESDLAKYRSHFGLSACTTGNGCFRKLNQRGYAKNYPVFNAGWAQEIALDTDMVSAICPNCHIVLIEGDTNSFLSLGLSEDTAVRVGANAVSNSYSGAESGAHNKNIYYKHPGHMITASTGDSGYSAGPQFPAASQWVTAVGGTTLRTGGGTRGWTETVWSGAGSGCSAVFKKPAWQLDTGCSKRTIGDVAADADPATGVLVVYNGNYLVFGGTSVSSPIIASVYALAGNADALRFASHGYSHTSDLYDITSGSNGHCSPAYLCTGEVGYDGPTGNGTPNGVGAF